MTLGEAALAYYDAGLCVIPLPPRSKKATISWGQYQKARPTREQVQAWWTAEPESNVAVVTGAISGVVVVDVDTYAGAVAAPWAASGVLLTTSCSGGKHYWYRYPNHAVRSVAEPNRAQYPHVDTRGDGGYIVMAPSRAPSKAHKGALGTYRYTGHIGVFDVCGLPPFTPEVEKMLFAGVTPVGVGQVATGGSTPPASADVTWISRALGHAVIGSQRQTMTRLAGYFAKEGTPLDVAQAIIVTAALHWPIGDPKHPWHISEINHCVQSIYAKEGTREKVDATTEGLRTWTFDEYMREFSGHSTQWLVEDWLPAGGVGLVVAPPQTYKTWFLLDLAVSVSTGEPFLGRYPVHAQGPVLYVQAEDPPRVLADRLAALTLSKRRQNRPVREDEPVHATELGNPIVGLVDPPAVTLSNGEGLNIGASGRAHLRAKVEELRPALVILDPLYAFAGTTEGYFQNVPSFMAFLKQLRAVCGTAFLIAHHTKKMSKEVGDAGREQTWGSNLMTAASEVDWQVRRLGAHAVTVQRHFKVAGGVEKTPFGVDIDIDAVPCLSVRELSEAEVEEAREAKTAAAAGATRIGRAKGSAVNADLAAEQRSLVMAALKSGPATAQGAANVLGISLRTVQRALQHLHQEGRVSKQGKGVTTTWVATKVDIKEVS